MAPVVLRALYSVATLYMLAILVRWFAPWLELNLHGPWVSWIPKVVDPFVNLLRRALLPMGPMDFGHIAAIFVVWLVRTFVAGAG